MVRWQFLVGQAQRLQRPRRRGSCSWSLAYAMACVARCSYWAPPQVQVRPQAPRRRPPRAGPVFDGPCRRHHGARGTRPLGRTCVLVTIDGWAYAIWLDVVAACWCGWTGHELAPADQPVDRRRCHVDDDRSSPPPGRRGRSRRYGRPRRAARRRYSPRSAASSSWSVIGDGHRANHGGAPGVFVACHVDGIVAENGAGAPPAGQSQLLADPSSRLAGLDQQRRRSRWPSGEASSPPCRRSR